jgi:hypothetical protein
VLAALEAGEFGMLGEPGIPTGEEGLAVALADEDAMEVASGYT